MTQVAGATTKADPEVLKKLGVKKNRALQRWFGRLTAVLVLLSLAGGVWFWRAHVNEPKPPAWVTAPAAIGDIRETVTATGTLSPLDAVDVGAELTGRVTKVTVDINDRVKKDQLLVEIDTEAYTARVEESGAQLNSALASRKNAEATAKEAEARTARTRELHSRGLVSDQDLETAEAELARANAAVASAKASITLASAGVKSARTTLGKATIRSPIDGIVLARSVEVGQTVTAGFQTPVLLTLARDLTQMELKIDVDEADVGKVRDGLAATFVVDAYPGRQFKSKVVRLNNLPKAGTTVVTYEALLTVDNGEMLLRPGMTATATIVTSEKKGVLTVPNAALRFQPMTAPSASAPQARGGGLPLPGIGRGFRSSRGTRRAPGEGGRERGEIKRGSVYVLEGGQPVRVPVEIGASDGRRSEVRSDKLKAGTQVVVDQADEAE